MRSGTDKRFRFLSRFLMAGLCTCLFVGASSATMAADRSLKLFEGRDCGQGFLRPPGVSKCLNLQDLVSPNPPFRAPKGKCPEHWQRYPANRFCLPSYVVVSCGDKTFPCRKMPSDILRVKPGPVDCPDGNRVVTVQFPSYDTSGELFLTSRIGLACGPLGKNEL